MIEEKKIVERKTAKPRIEQILQFLTAEHAALQSARVNAVADGNSRLYVFLLAVVGGVIALAFIGQIAGTGQQMPSPSTNSAQVTTQPVTPVPGIPGQTPAAATTPAAQVSNVAGQGFFWFGLLLFPALFFLGLTTFVRALQAAMEDLIHARGIARIRNFYAEFAPEMRDYIVHPIHDDRLETLQNVSVARTRLQPFVTAAGTVAVINSILAGAWLAILLQFAFTPPVWLAAILGAFLFAVSLAGHLFYQSRRWEDFEANLDAPKFPAASTV